MFEDLFFFPHPDKMRFFFFFYIEPLLSLKWILPDFFEVFLFFYPAVSNGLPHTLCRMAFAIKTKMNIYHEGSRFGLAFPLSPQDGMSSNQHVYVQKLHLDVGMLSLAEADYIHGTQVVSITGVLSNYVECLRAEDVWSETVEITFAMYAASANTTITCIGFQASKGLFYRFTHHDRSDLQNYAKRRGFLMGVSRMGLPRVVKDTVFNVLSGQERLRSFNYTRDFSPPNPPPYNLYKVIKDKHEAVKQLEAVVMVVVEEEAVVVEEKAVVVEEEAVVVEEKAVVVEEDAVVVQEEAVVVEEEAVVVEEKAVVVEEKAVVVQEEAVVVEEEAVVVAKEKAVVVQEEEQEEEVSPFVFLDIPEHSQVIGTPFLYDDFKAELLHIGENMVGFTKEEEEVMFLENPMPLQEINQDVLQKKQRVDSAASLYDEYLQGDGNMEGFSSEDFMAIFHPPEFY